MLKFSYPDFLDRPTEYIKFQRLSIDFVDSSVADVIHQISYKVEIFSTNGIVFKNGVFNTTLIARIYQVQMT